MMIMIKNADNTVFNHGNHLITGISGSDNVFKMLIYPTTYYITISNPINS